METRRNCCHRSSAVHDRRLDFVRPALERFGEPHRQRTLDSHYADALGHDTLVVTPIDSTDKSMGGAADSTMRVRQRTVFTVMDRDSIAEAIAPNRAEVCELINATIAAATCFLSPASRSLILLPLGL